MSHQSWVIGHHVMSAVSPHLYRAGPFIFLVGGFKHFLFSPGSLGK